MKPTSYIVTIRGQVPPDLGEKLAALHAQAVLATAKKGAGQGKEQARRLTSGPC